MAAPKRWDPDGYDRIVSGLTKAGRTQWVACVAAEFAVLARESNDDPNLESWVDASSVARRAAALLEEVGAETDQARALSALATWPNRTIEPGVDGPSFKEAMRLVGA